MQQLPAIIRILTNLKASQWPFMIWSLLALVIAASAAVVIAVIRHTS